MVRKELEWCGKKQTLERTYFLDGTEMVPGILVDSHAQGGRTTQYMADPATTRRAKQTAVKRIIVKEV